MQTVKRKKKDTKAEMKTQKAKEEHEKDNNNYSKEKNMHLNKVIKQRPKKVEETKDGRKEEENNLE
eukprot:8741536-Heterocapsa_arctica.AAC.1